MNPVMHAPVYDVPGEPAVLIDTGSATRWVLVFTDHGDARAYRSTEAMRDEAVQLKRRWLAAAADVAEAVDSPQGVLL